MLIGLCTWYMGCLNAFPLYTKSLTSAVISLLGDGGAQYHEETIRAKEIGSHTNLKHFKYNRRRGLTNFADSALICGPMLHYGYDWLESAIPVVNHVPACRPCALGRLHTQQQLTSSSMILYSTPSSSPSCSYRLV